MEHTASIETMYSDAGSALHTLRYRYFVLWDTKDHRGWLVNGPVAALQLLRSYIKDREPNFDFSKLKHISDETPSAAYDVLKDKDNMKMVVVPGSEAGESSEDQDDAKKNTLEHVCFNVYKVLLELSRITITQLKNKTGNNIPDWFQNWVGRRWDTTVKGWDFQRLYHCYEPQVYVKKFHTDPGWLGLATELDAAFLFGGSFGDIMRPDDGHCCPYFKTLPKGENYLAVSMATIQTCVNNEGAAQEADDTVAKLAGTIGWERDVNPFSHQHGQGEHINQVDASCFPVQRLVRIRDNVDKRQKDRDLLRKSKGRLYSWKEVDDMNTAATDVNKETVKKKPKTGVVVFGKKPDQTELRQLAQANAPAAVGSLSRTTTQQSQAGATQRPPDSTSSRSNTSVADPRGARTSTNDPAQPSVAPAGRALSVASIRSTHSNTQRKASGDRPGGDRPQQSTSQTSTTSAQRTPSISSIRSTASNTHPKAPNSALGAGPLQTSSPQTLANSTHKTASNASLRSTGSGTRPRPAIASSGRPGESIAETKAPIAARKPSSSSVRTTSSIDSKATGGSQPQIPAVHSANLSLKKTNTHSSDKTTSSRSSRGTQNSTAGSTTADSRRRPDPLGAVTAGIGGTESHHPTSSGPAPAAGSGPDGS